MEKLYHGSWPKIPVSALTRGIRDWMTFIICLILLLLLLLTLLLISLIVFLFLFPVVGEEGLRVERRNGRMQGRRERREIGQRQRETTQQKMKGRAHRNDENLQTCFLRKH